MKVSYERQAHMGDAKTPYSEASKYYVENTVATSGEQQKAYDKSKERERRHGKKWEKQKVNINEIVDEFAPGDSGRAVGQKFIFEGERYNVVADMAAGYLRIWDSEQGDYVRLDGTLGANESETHFKIKRWEEM